MSSPRPLWIAAGIVFAVATVWINYEVKVVMATPSMADFRKTETDRLKTGQMAPDFSVADLSKVTVRLSDYRGKKAVVLDFWATWCGPCRMSMPNLEKLALELKGRDFEILSVDEGEDTGTVAAFAARENYPFHFVLDSDSSVGRNYGVNSIPTQVLIDKNGLVRWVRVGYSPRDDELRKLLKVVSAESASVDATPTGGIPLATVVTR